MIVVGMPESAQSRQKVYAEKFDLVPGGEGANIDRRLVPYHGECKRIQSHIEFIYIYIFIYIINGLLTCGIGKFGPGK